DAWVDWHEWTVDKIKLQRDNVADRDPVINTATLAASTVGLAASPLSDGPRLVAQGCYRGRLDYLMVPDSIDNVFSELEKLVDMPSMSRTIRKLEVPKKVEINFRGKLTASHAILEKEVGNKYNV